MFFGGLNPKKTTFDFKTFKFLCKTKGTLCVCREKWKKEKKCLNISTHKFFVNPQTY